MKERILVVDDEQEIADLVALYLENENYTVLKYYSAQEALRCIETEKLDLAMYTYPVIMLTAKVEEIDKITGLTLGADDYITKPFLPLELVARVKAQLRRYKRYNAGGTAEDEDVLVVSGLVLNVKTHQCTLNERPLALTPTEFSILQILCQRRGQVVNAEELFHAIWGDEYFYKSNNTITVHIRHLREKMGDSAENPRYIKTVWGCGYKIEG